MGKKTNKEINTVQDQMDYIKAIEDIIYGKDDKKLSITDISKIDDSDVIMDSGLSKEENDVLINKLNNHETVEEEAEYFYDEEEYNFDPSKTSINVFDELEDENDDDEYKDEYDYDYDYAHQFNQLKFIWNSSDDENKTGILKTKLYIDDSVAPMTIDYETILDYKNKLPYLTEKLDLIPKAGIDSDFACHMMKHIVDSIVSKKFPAAIYTIDEFKDTFEGYDTYDNVRVKLFRDDKYIYCYSIDFIYFEGFFYNSFNDYSNDDILRIMLGINEVCKNPFNLFDRELRDDAYADIWLNNKDVFEYCFKSILIDEFTNTAPGKGFFDPIDEIPSFDEVERLVERDLNLLNQHLYEDEEDEEEESIECAEAENEVDNKEEPETVSEPEEVKEEVKEDNEEDTDDFSDLIDDSMEEVKPESDDTDDLVVEVHRKKG